MSLADRRKPAYKPPQPEPAPDIPEMILETRRRILEAHTPRPDTFQFPANEP